MKIVTLLENTACREDVAIGHGLSQYIETENHKLLSDLGPSEETLKNAETLGIDLNRLTHVVLSHGHDDHTRGLSAFFIEGPKPKLVAHPSLFRRLWSRGLSIGCPYTRAKLARYFDLCLTAEPLALTENLFYLGAIPRVFPEQADQAQRQGEDGPDLTLDDTALAYRGREGVYVITGCSHSGIGNIVERAKQVTGMDRVLGVIGGFHLRQMDERSQGIIDYLEGEHIPNLYPCHCTALSVKVAMGNRMHIEEVGTGTGLEWV